MLSSVRTIDSKLILHFPPLHVILFFFCTVKRETFSKVLLHAVLWIRIRIRMDPELLPGFGSGIIVPDQDPAKYERADK